MGSSHGVNRIIGSPTTIFLLCSASAPLDELWWASCRPSLESSSSISPVRSTRAPRMVRCLQGRFARASSTGFRTESVLVRSSACVSLLSIAAGSPCPPATRRRICRSRVRAIVAHVEGAIEASATIRAREPLLEWASIPSGCACWHEGMYEAEQLIISAGAWAASLVFRTCPRSRFQSGRSWLGSSLAEPGTVPAGALSGVQSDGPKKAATTGFRLRHLRVEGRRYHHLDERIDPDDWDREAE